MNTRVLLLAALFFVSGFAGAAETRTLVLVTSADANIQVLSQRDARKLYLGVAVMNNDQRLKALRNLEDPFLEEVFLQQIIFLSAPAYEKQLLSRIFRRGGQRPVAYENQARLVNTLLESLNTVTYMWARDVVGDSRLKNLGELWTGSVD